jgi:hypothetical protein
VPPRSVVGQFLNATPSTALINNLGTKAITYNNSNVDNKNNNNNNALDSGFDASTTVILPDEISNRKNRANDLTMLAKNFILHGLKEAFHQTYSVMQVNLVVHFQCTFFFMCHPHAALYRITFERVNIHFPLDLRGFNILEFLLRLKCHSNNRFSHFIDLYQRRQFNQVHHFRAN